jgi:2,5-furandicarboxylate decarboxylase 1
MREAIESLRAQGHLLEVTQEVDPVFEMGAYAAAAAGWPLLLHLVRGARFPMLYNLFGQADWLARWMGREPACLIEAFHDACEHPGQPFTTTSQHDLVVDGPLNLAEWIPIGRDYPRQSVPCMNPAVVFVRDPDTDFVNTSMHSLNLIAPDRMVVHVRAMHFAQIYGKWQRLGKPMPVAVALGMDPAIWLAFGLANDHPPTELEVASALAGPVALAPCGTVDLEVPLASEIVLEGFVPPNERGPGGPEPLPAHLYGPPYHGPVIQVRRLTAFSDAVAHGLLNGSPDHLNTMHWLKEFEVVRHLRDVGLFEGVRALKVNPFGGNWCLCAIAVDRAHVGNARAILETLLTSTLRLGGIRRAVVVDEDIDVGNPRMLDWALATRMRPERDLFVTDPAKVRGVDPMSRDGALSKLGLDATIPPGREDDYRMIEVPWPATVELPRQMPNIPAPVPQTF